MLVSTDPTDADVKNGLTDVGYEIDPELVLGRTLRIPAELRKAQQESRLVIFAGAGVSKDAPSNLPNFVGLAEEIAGRKFSEEDKKHPERVLGRLVDEDISVHRPAQGILGRADSQPTDLHRSLIQLFPKAKELRIVTTNADRHFSTVMREMKLEGQVKTYYTPALPLGNDFTGLVYLHGSVDRDPRRMILTDLDFGHAYLTDAYAARFLERMFSEFTVLFVGYSHKDAVMQFLSRGLDRRCERFALTVKADASHWRPFGIAPISYLKHGSEDEHAEVRDGLRLWATYTKLSPSEREQKIREIVSNPPHHVDATAMSYLEWQLSESLGAKLFARHAKGVQWLLRVEPHPAFRSIFSSKGEVSDVQCSLAEWFCQEFVLGNDASAGLAVVERLGPCVSPVLWHRIALRLSSAKTREPTESVGAWVGVLLASHEPTFNCKPLCFLLVACQLPEEIGIATLLFDFLTRPRAALERGFSLDAGSLPKTVKPRMNLKGLGDTNKLLIDFVQRKVQPHARLLFNSLLPIVEQNLSFGYRLLLAAGEASRFFSMVSFRRVAIELQEQNMPPEDIDVLIDTARVLIEWAALDQPALLDGYIGWWMGRSVPLLRRLAVYAMSRRTDTPADDKLNWLLEQDLLFSTPEKHEMFGLLAGVFAQASPALQARTVEAATATKARWAGSVSRVASDYEKYNLLVWLTKIAPDSQVVSDALAEVNRQHPKFEPREHPDFSHWCELGYAPGVSEAEVERVLLMTPTEVVNWLASCHEAQRIEDACETRPRLLEVAVAKSFDWGMDLAEQLVRQTPIDPDPWTCVIDGLRKADKQAEDWKQLLEFLSQEHELLREYTLDVTWLLRDAVRLDRENLLADLNPNIFSLAMKLWHNHPHQTPDQWMNLAEAAIHQPGGVVAEILVQLARQQRRLDDSWDKLPASYREAFAELLSTREDAAPYARVILAGFLHVLYDCDPDWSRETIIPLLNWKKNEEHATQAWHGYLLTWGCWSNTFLEDLLPFYAQTASKLSSFDKDCQQRFAEHIASILLFATRDPLAGNWISSLLQAEPENLGRDVSDHAQELLNQTDDVARRGFLWKTRLRPYWDSRIHGPLPTLSSAEKLSMLEWIFPLESVFPSVVDMVLESDPPGQLELAFFNRLYNTSTIWEKFPIETAKLCLHLARGLPDAHPPLRFKGLLVRLQQANLAPDVLEKLRNEAVRLGVDLDHDKP